ncbi:MAG TPA: hypothetical protein VFQ45_18920 [Longimicrobium sp.]|nr:hypothetical protein [Longimicrobium sp.]
MSAPFRHSASRRRLTIAAAAALLVLTPRIASACLDTCVKRVGTFITVGGDTYIIDSCTLTESTDSMTVYITCSYRMFLADN